jgi:hypothetical protein
MTPQIRGNQLDARRIQAQREGVVAARMFG